MTAVQGWSGRFQRLSDGEDAGGRAAGRPRANRRSSSQIGCAQRLTGSIEAAARR